MFKIKSKRFFLYLSNIKATQTGLVFDEKSQIMDPVARIRILYEHFLDLPHILYTKFLKNSWRQLLANVPIKSVRQNAAVLQCDPEIDDILEILNHNSTLCLHKVLNL